MKHLYIYRYFYWLLDQEVFFSCVMSEYSFQSLFYNFHKRFIPINNALSWLSGSVGGFICAW